tara:strand:- start:49 stop:3399 length:3351 start_codon:yes stop_codon:yes gene_type:complete
MLNNQQAIQRVQQTFLYPYSDENYKNFISDLLNNLQANDNFEKQIKNDDHIESYKKIGFYEDNNGDIIDILSVKVKNGAILERTRTKLRDFTVNHIENSPTDPDGCLVAFHAEEFSDWRFSFVKMDYKVVKDLKTGKFKTDKTISEPKRYSFLIGKDEPSYTAQKQMIPLLQSSNIAFNDIVDAFSTERVTNEFYQAYRALFEDLTLSLVQIKENDPKIKENFEKEFIKEDDFAKKLLGQIVFIYFIQRKGWLGIKKDNNGNFGKWGSGDKKFIRNLFNKKYCQYNNFFNDVLEHLFYNGLGTENSDNYFSLLDCKIPFLNGGIFEPLNNYNWQETDIVIEDEVVEEILDVFDRFNFTVREESELDVDVAVDPEMLGRVFENLLPENIRKGKAAYYTPRRIVKYMCQESIINYLDSETADYIDIGKIQDFIKRNNVEKLSKSNAELLDSLLKDVKICDPAIGSGAFPMGLLNQIVESRSLLCSLTEKKIDKYDLKRYAIINSIYGVDLDPGAVEIAKLRLFLSLIVDEKDFESIEPLPNLDFQIMQGDSLIEEFYGITLDINKKTVQGEIFEDVNKIDELINNLHQAQATFSNESNYKKKKELKNKVENCIIDIFKFKYNEKKNISAVDAEQMNRDIEQLIHGKNPRYFFPWKLYFADIFRTKGGFDIVIANPPYIQMQKKMNEKADTKYADLYKELNFQTFTRMGDIYCLFYELGINLLKNNGFLTYITSNKWMRAGYGKSLRNHLSKKNPLKLIDFEGTKIFESATVDTNIITLQNCENKNETEAVKINNNIHINDQIHNFFDSNKSILRNLSNEIWFISSQEEIHLKNKIESKFPRLNEWKNNIYFGIKTGYNDAYLIDNNEYKNLINKQPNNNKHIKPVLRGKDIKPYSCEFKELYLMFIPWHFPLNNDKSISGASIKAENAFKSQYPYMYEHLLKFKDKLSKRNQSETGIRYEWYALQRCANSYFEEFDKPKIIYSEIVREPQFFFDKTGKYYADATSFILTGDNLEYLLSIFHSKCFSYLFKTFYAGGNLGKEGYRYKKAFINNVPIPKITNDNKDVVDKIVYYTNQIIKFKEKNQNHDILEIRSKIDLLVYKLYELSEDEIKTVNSLYE